MKFMEYTLKNEINLLVGLVIKEINLKEFCSKIAD
jgi:hypothetical protein